MTSAARFLRLDRALWVVLFIGLAVVLPRSAWIATAHSESIDDEYHLVRGVRFLQGALGKTPLNDPTLGETIIALPLWLAGAQPIGNHKFGMILHGQSVAPEVLLMYVAMFKSLLFVAFLPFVFAWVRKLYNTKAAAAVVAVFLLEPTITAHITPAALDILGFQAIAIACWLWWRYFEKPTWALLVTCSVVSGAAMLIKHTAIILPFVALAYAGLFCLWRRAPGETVGEWMSKRWKHASVAPVIAFASLTFFSGGFSPMDPPQRLSKAAQARAATQAAARAMMPAIEAVDEAEPPAARSGWKTWNLPAGSYFRSLRTAAHHGSVGHSSWFLGERNDKGNIFYYPVVALYKIPIPLLVFAGIGALSLVVIRPRFGEWAIVVPTVLLTALLLKGGINIGFRHAIPVYAFLFMLSGRALAMDRKWMTAIVGALLVVTLVDVARWCPNYISYLNWPRKQVWMQINDSNLDWGQGVKQVRAWIDSNRQRLGDQPIYVRLFGLTYTPAIEYYLGDRVIKIQRNDPPPDKGILIVSPVYIVGLFDKPGNYDFLQGQEPMATIGESNLVYDLGRARRAEKRRKRAAKEAD